MGKVPFEIPHKISDPHTKRFLYNVEILGALRFKLKSS